MSKKMRGIIAAAAFAVTLAAVGCSTKESSALKDKEETATVTVTEETEWEAENNEEEETISPEQMDLIKYNYYVELNNDIVTILSDIDYYFQVVDYKEEFALIQDSGYTYGYRVSGVNSAIVDDCLELSDMEPAYEALDPLVKEMAEPLKELMETFSKVGRGGDYANNQYEKAKEYHAVIYPAAQKFEELGYEFISQVSQVADERIAKEEEKMKEDGRLIAYNASHGISIVEDILKECRKQEVTDENLTDLDLTNIKPLYDELIAVVDDLNAAMNDTEQIMKESISMSSPFSGLYDRMIQALEWMIKQVESGRPLEDPSLEPLGSLAHVSNTLSDCIDRYNSVFVD